MYAMYAMYATFVARQNTSYFSHGMYDLLTSIWFSSLHFDTIWQYFNDVLAGRLVSYYYYYYFKSEK